MQGLELKKSHSFTIILAINYFIFLSFFIPWFESSSKNSRPIKICLSQNFDGNPFWAPTRVLPFQDHFAKKILLYPYQREINKISFTLKFCRIENLIKIGLNSVVKETVKYFWIFSVIYKTPKRFFPVKTFILQEFYGIRAWVECISIKSSIN